MTEWLIKYNLKWPAIESVAVEEQQAKTFIFYSE
jgi:hypothetical protein